MASRNRIWPQHRKEDPIVEWCYFFDDSFPRKVSVHKVSKDKEVCMWCGDEDLQAKKREASPGRGNTSEHGKNTSSGSRNESSCDIWQSLICG